MRSLLFLVFVLLLNGCSTDDSKPEVAIVSKEDLQGNWRLTDIRLNGTVNEDDECERMDVIKFTPNDLFVTNFGNFAGICIITNNNKVTYNLNDNNLTYIGNPNDPDEFAIDGSLELIENTLRVTEEFGSGANIEVFITSYIKIDDIIGKWRLTNINANGDNDEDDECERLDTIEFFENGAIHVVNFGFSNGSCVVSNDTFSTYSIVDSTLNYVGNPLDTTESEINGSIEIFENKTLTVREEIDGDNGMEIFITSYERIN